VGKSALFAALTGLHATISNYPGTTVEITAGTLPGGGRLTDTPGLGSLLPSSEEERVTRDLLLEERPEAVVVVADEKNLVRGLSLVLQLGEMELPCVLCLNMADEARARGIHVRARALEEALGVPVVRTVATRHQGVARLLDALGRASLASLRVDYGRALEEEAARVEARLPASLSGRRGLALLLLAGDRTLAPWLGDHMEEEDLRAAEEMRFHAAASDEPVSSRIRRARLARAGKLAEKVVERRRRRRADGLAERFGEWALHLLWGKVILAVVLLALFWLVGLLGAGTLVDFLETAVFGEALTPAAIAATDFVFPFPHEHARETVSWELTIPLTPTREVPTGLGLSRETVTTDYQVTGPLGPWGKTMRFFHDLLVGKFGLFTMGISYALAIVLPIVTLFFLAFALLEDTGYLPRLAVMVNRAFRSMGLNGKAVLPMVLGLGCVSMATLTARILDSRKQRLQVVFLMALAVPCSAQLGVVLGLLATVSGAAVVVWAGILLGVLLLIGWLSARVLPGEDSPLVLELPPIRVPSPRNLVVKTLARIEWYLREAVPIFLLGAFLLFLLDRTGLLRGAEDLLEPVVTGLLGLPIEATPAFLVGFLRRDYGAIYLLEAAREGLLGPAQALVSAVVVTLFVPCVANVLIIAREWGWRIALTILGTVIAISLAVGGLLNGVLAATGWMS